MSPTGPPAAAASPRPAQVGQALVELALIMPVFLLLLMLAVDFGRLFTTYIAVNNAAREGAFYAAERAMDRPWSQSAFENGARDAGLREANVQAQGGEGGLTINAPVCFTAIAGTTIECRTAADNPAGSGNFVSVSARQPFTFLTPIVGELFGGSLNLDATATAPVLNPASVTVLAPSPTPSATPTATATSAATATPTATATTPGETASPTPVPQCTVPDFDDYYFNVDPSALEVWRDVAGFTGELVDDTSGRQIKSQSLQPDTDVDCTSTMTVDDSNRLAY